MISDFLLKISGSTTEIYLKKTNLMKFTVFSVFPIVVKLFQFVCWIDLIESPALLIRGNLISFIEFYCFKILKI